MEFFYEYDDLFRVTSVVPVYNAVKTQAVRLQYDSRQGRLIKLDNFTFLRDGSFRRIMGENVSYFLSFYGKIHVR